MFNRHLHNLSYLSIVVLYIIYFISCYTMGQAVSDALSPCFLFFILVIFIHAFFVKTFARVRIMTLALVLASLIWLICDLTWFFQNHFGYSTLATRFLCSYGYYFTNVFLLTAVAVNSTVELKKMHKVQEALDIFVVIFLLIIFLWEIVFKSENKNILAMSSDPLSMTCFVVDVVMLAWLAIWTISVKFLLLDIWQQLFMLGCLVFTVTDIAYLYYYYYMAYIPNTMIDQLYLLSFLMILPVSRTKYLSDKQFMESRLNDNFKVEKTILLFVIPLLYMLYRKEVYDYAGMVVSVIILYLIASGLIKENKIKEKFLNLEKETLEHLNQKNGELLELKDSIEKEQTLLEAVFLSMTDGVVSVNGAGEIETMNFVAEKIAECSNEKARGKNINELFEICNEDGMKDELFINKINVENGNEFGMEEDRYLRNSSGKLIPIEYSISPIIGRKSEIQGSLFVFRDYTDKKRKIEKIRFLSSHDQLTGLFNRHYFEEELLMIDTPENLPISIAMIDVNGLKLVNDSFGHEKGDELLRVVSNVLMEFGGTDTLISRIGGDEFTILFSKMDAKKTRTVKNKIISRIQDCRMDYVVVSISIGVSTKVNPKQNMIDVLKEAEVEMYSDKLKESPIMRGRTIQSIYNCLSEIDSYKAHFEQVGQLCRQIGELLQYDNDTLAELETAGRMHDIGKIIFESIRENNEDEILYQESYRKHSEAGYQILRSSNDFQFVADCTLCHHEHWDGSGFPRGLKRENIPIFARIIAVANTYTKALEDGCSVRESKQIIQNASGLQLDPGIVELFSSLPEE